MTRTLILLLAALVVAMGISARGKTEPGSTPTGGGAMMSAQTAEESSPRFAKSTGRKVIFSTPADAQALAAKGPTVLFFAADWCPTCQAALKDINANGERMTVITIVVVDYDRSADLKRRYGVTTQHTFVQIDADGAKLAAWNGGGVDVIVKNTKRA
jgi:thiol-disulfide isomerase/thioredoxin